MGIRLVVATQNETVCSEVGALLQELLDFENVAYEVSSENLSVLRWESPRFYQSLTVEYVTRQPDHPHSFTMNITGDDVPGVLRYLFANHLGPEVQVDADVTIFVEDVHD